MRNSVGHWDLQHWWSYVSKKTTQSPQLLWARSCIHSCWVQTLGPSLLNAEGILALTSQQTWQLYIKCLILMQPKVENINSTLEEKGMTLLFELSFNLSVSAEQEWWQCFCYKEQSLKIVSCPDHGGTCSCRGEGKEGRWGRSQEFSMKVSVWIGKGGKPRAAIRAITPGLCCCCAWREQMSIHSPLFSF